MSKQKLWNAADRSPAKSLEKMLVAAECIIRDLCPPAGPNVHVKAFYFLSGRYRDESAMIGEDRDGVMCRGWGTRLIRGGVSILGLALLLPMTAIITSIKIKYEIRMGMGMGAGC